MNNRELIDDLSISLNKGENRLFALLLSFLSFLFSLIELLKEYFNNNENELK
jgi:hypothetical protein